MASEAAEPAVADPAANAAGGESAGRTFLLTTIGETSPEPKGKHKGDKKPLKFRTLESTNDKTRIMDHHSDLTNLANTLDQRMAALLREHEKDFFLAYKTHMYTVQKEIKTLRMKADHEEAKTREDTKIKALEGELDWFMTEALRLDELCKGYKKEVDKWKAKAEALDEDRRFLEDQIKGAKRQNKILRAAAERARSSAYSALLATRARAEDGGGGGGYPNGGEQLALPGAGNEARAPRPNSVSGGPAVGSGAKRAQEARARTPDARQGLGSNVPASASSSMLTALAGGAGRSPTSAPAVADQHVASTTSLISSVGPGGLGGTGRGGGVLGNEAEERYVQAIQHLKESIVREQHNVRMLQATRATSYSQKSELEEFFLKCIDEARKELMRKRHSYVHKEKGERDKVLEAMLNNEDVLVCLYEKLFPHRTGIARSLGGPANDGEDARLLSRLPTEAGGGYSH